MKTLIGSLIIALSFQSCAFTSPKLWYSALYYKFETKTCEAEVSGRNQAVSEKFRSRVIDKTEIPNLPKNQLAIYDSSILSKRKKELKFIQMTFCFSGKQHEFMVLDGGNIDGYLLANIDTERREEMENKAKDGISVLKTEDELLKKISELIKESRPK